MKKPYTISWKITGVITVVSELGQEGADENFSCLSPEEILEQSRKIDVESTGISEDFWNPVGYAEL